MYLAHRKLWSGSGVGRKTTAHTHRGEYGQRVPWLEKGLQRERNLQLTNRINRIRRIPKYKDKSKEEGKER